MSSIFIFLSQSYLQLVAKVVVSSPTHYWMMNIMVRGCKIAAVPFFVI